jgi:hypothetical protein
MVALVANGALDDGLALCADGVSYARVRCDEEERGPRVRKTIFFKKNFRADRREY